jgi:hypothetical protein
MSSVAYFAEALIPSVETCEALSAAFRSAEFGAATTESLSAARIALLELGVADDDESLEQVLAEPCFVEARATEKGSLRFSVDMGNDDAYDTWPAIWEILTALGATEGVALGENSSVGECCLEYFKDGERSEYWTGGEEDGDLHRSAHGKQLYRGRGGCFGRCEGVQLRQAGCVRGQLRLDGVRCGPRRPGRRQGPEDVRRRAHARRVRVGDATPKQRRQATALSPALGPNVPCFPSVKSAATTGALSWTT